MATIRHDLSSVSSFTVREPGDYPAFIFALEPVISQGAKTKGAQMLKAQYKYEDGGGSVFDNIILTPDLLWKWKQVCIAAGIDPDRLGADSEIETGELLGERVVVSVGIQPANDQYPEKNVVKKVSSYDTFQSSASALPAGW